jgi:hypothetical protein
VESIVIAVLPTILVVSLSVLGLHPGVFAARTSAWNHLPPNIRTTADLRPLIEDLLARSPTLRAQCVRIAVARQTYVSVTVSLAPFPSLARARSTARRYHTGLLVVDVEIPPASQDFAELLAHELEHVIEFIEGLDFKHLAKTRGAGVVQCDNSGSFETDRAKIAGRTVKFEIQAN